MLAPHIRGALSLFGLTALAACGGGSSEPNGGNTDPSDVSIVSGNGQVGLPGTVLPVPIAVRVTSSGTPIRGKAVNFAVTAGAASVSPAAATTDSSGQAKTQVTLGGTPGNVTITASVGGTGLVATFVQTVGQSNAPQACASGQPQSPATGGVLPGVSGTGICLAGGASGAEYALVAFYGNSDSSAVQNLQVTGKGAVAVTSASSITPNFNVAPFPYEIEPGEPSGLRSKFDAGLREMARRELTPLMPAARQSFRRSASMNVIPSNPTIGSLVTLNANAIQACSSIRNRTSRVAAVSNNAIVVADTGNPAGGFTDAEYASFATLFDTLVNQLSTQTFGTPSDVDRNGKVVIFFTKEVNALTPKTGGDGVIGGFFFERDLFPLQDDNANRLQGCAGSNVAEMFYLLVPDSAGVFSRPHTKQSVLEITPSTIIHEFQHLINAGRRLYVNNANEFEDTWLNEGLSHIAEELLYFKVSNLAPRQNIGPSTIRASQASVDNFNKYQLDNNGRFELFIAKPAQTSVFVGTGSLETRGATWSLLRYLADHRGNSDADVWSSLVNTTFTGQGNLAAVFGQNYMTQVRDWATSLFADDLPGMTDARFAQPSWNMRAIFPQLVNSQGQALGRYPLTVVPVSDATPANVSVSAGAAAYIRFSVPANTSASIDWSANGLPVSGLMQFSVVRTK